MQDRVELIGQARVKVMTHQFRFRPVDHADGAFEPFITQRRRDIDVVSKSEKEIWNIDFVKKRFVTFRMCRTHIFALGRSVPVRRRRDCAVVSGEANRHSFLSKMFAHELAEIEFAALAHLCRARIAQVRIVRPDDDFRWRPLLLK